MVGVVQSLIGGGSHRAVSLRTRLPAESGHFGGRIPQPIRSRESFDLTGDCAMRRSTGLCAM
jgi:hypothetical protein